MYAPGGTRRWRLSEADLERLVRAAAEAFRPEAAVLAAYLHGSAARGESAVDLDVALLLDAPLAPARLEELASTLQAMGAPAGPAIDLRPLTGAGPRFQFNVIKEGRVLFERSRDARLTREARIMSCWADFKPTWECMRARMRERMDSWVRHSWSSWSAFSCAWTITVCRSPGTSSSPIWTHGSR